MKNQKLEPGTTSNQTQRLDKWLKIARILKTRSIASEACQDGKVKVNGEVAKASKLVKVGDELTIKMRGGKYRTLEILAISHKSVSAKDALLLYKEEKLELSHESQELFDLQWQVAKTIKPKYKGRPTKKERRKIDQFKQKSDL